MIRIATTIVLFLLLTTAASAQLPGGNVFFGYSYMSADLVSGDRTNLNGWNGSVEGKVLPFIGIVGDFSGHYGSQGICLGTGNQSCAPLNLNASLAEHNFLFGPRVSFSVKKFRPFVHALFGAGHISESATGFSNSDTSFAYAIGGGLDYHLVPLVSWRLQGDSLQTRFFSGTQSNVRISTGVVIHF